MKKNLNAVKPLVTLKSVCDGRKNRLCAIPQQDFYAAALVREVQRAVDPKGTKALTKAQARMVRKFLNIVVATAYK